MRRPGEIEDVSGISDKRRTEKGSNCAMAPHQTLKMKKIVKHNQAVLAKTKLVSDVTRL